MADKLNIQFRINAVDNFSRTLNKLESKLADIQQQANGMRYAVAVNVHLDDGDFQVGADAIARKKSSLDEAISVGIRLDGYTEFMNEMDNAVDKVPTKGRTIAYKLEVKGEGMASLAAFEAEVDRIERKMENESAMYVEANVDLDRKGFDAKYYPLLEDMMDLERKVTVSVDVDGYLESKTKLENIQKSVPSTNNIYFNLKATDKFTKNFDKLDRRILGSRLLLQELNNTKVDIEVDSGLPDLMKDMKDVIRESKKATKTKITVPIELGGMQRAWQDFQSTMAKFANISRNVGELLSHYLIGNLISMLPAIVPLIASIGGVLGSLLPIIGTVGGGIFAFGTSFGLAGVGAVMATSLITSALGDVFKVSEKQVELNKKLANTTDLEERAKIMEELESLQGSLNDSQLKALDSLNKMKGTWGEISKSLAPQSIATFISLMDTLTGALVLLEPTFKSVSDHAQKLAEFLNMQLETDDMKAFFDFLSVSAGPALETLGQAAINFGIGLLNMMEAFGPLATDMQNGFLKMSEGFREWAANLSESDRFQSFMDYVRDNLPKLGTIFGGFIDGVVGMGEAFAPFTADMLTGLADMMTRFGEWGAALSENQGFKDFIAYVQENGPAIMDFFGELVDFLINLGEAFSDVGPEMVAFATWALDVANALMDGNPEMAKFVAAVAAIAAMILLHLPTYLLLASVLKRIGGNAEKSSPKVGTMGDKVKTMGGKFKTALLWVGRLALGFLTMIGPIGWVILAVAGLAAAIIYWWDEITAWTKKMWKKFEDAGTDGVQAVIDAVVKFGPAIMDVFDGIDLFESGKKIIKSVISGITNMIPGVKTAAGLVASAINRFFPHSPAKEGALSNLDKLDFEGPVVKSLNRDAGGINRAMGNLLVAPELNAGGYAGGGSTYSARSAGYAKQQSPQDMAAAFAGGIAIQSSDVIMSGEKVGKVTWKATTAHATRDKDIRTKFERRGRA